MHILLPSIWCVTTPRYYFCGATFIITNRKCYGKKPKVSLTWSLTKCEIDQSLILGVHLTRGQPDWSSNPLVHKMSLPRGYIWPEVNLSTVVTCLAKGFLSQGVHLTRGQPDWSSNTVVHKMSLPWGYIWPEVNLSAVVTQLATRCLSWGMSDQVNLTAVVIHVDKRCFSWGSIWPMVSLTQRSHKNVNLTLNLT